MALYHNAKYDEVSALQRAFSVDDAYRWSEPANVRASSYIIWMDHDVSWSKFS